MSTENKKRPFSELNEDEMKQLIKKKKQKLRELRKVNRELKKKNVFLGLIQKISTTYQSVEILDWVNKWRHFHIHVHTCGSRDWQMDISCNNGNSAFHYIYEGGENELKFETKGGEKFSWMLDETYNFGTTEFAGEIKDAIGLPNTSLPIFVGLVKEIISFVAGKYEVHLEPMFRA